MPSKAKHPRPDVEAQPLSADEVAEILLNVDIDDVILVGGQALIAWAGDLSAAAGPDLDQYGPYTSFDLDFYGPKAAAKKFAARIGGRVKLATLDDIGTVNAATVTYERNGRPIVVDFLTGLMGVSRDQIEKDGLVQLGMLLQGTTTPVNVLHPLLVLQSKISNVVGFLKRLDDGSLNQMRAAAVILRAYLFQLLAQGGDSLKEAQDVVQDLGRYALTSREAELACVAHSLDLADLLDAVARHDSWDPRFRAHQIEKVATRIRTKLARKAANKALRDALRKPRAETPESGSPA